MRMNDREKKLVGAGVAVVVLFVGYQWAVRPAAGRIRTLKRVLAEKERERAEVLAKAAEYMALQRELTDLRRGAMKANKNFGLMAYLERLQIESGVAKNVTHVKPTTAAVNENYIERIVDLRLAKVRLAQVVAFLQRVESSEVALRVSSLRIRKDPRAADLLDVQMQIRLLALAESG